MTELQTDRFYQPVSYRHSTDISNFLINHPKCQTDWGLGSTYCNEVGAENREALRELVANWKYNPRFTVDYQRGHLVLLYGNGVPVIPYDEHRSWTKDDLMYMWSVVTTFDILCDNYMAKVHNRRTKTMMETRI